MRRFLDIKPPKHKKKRPELYKVPIDLPYIPISVATQPGRPHFRIPVLAVALIFLLVVGGFGLNLFQFKKKAENTGPVVYNNLKQGAAALFSFDLGKAKEYFQKASDDVAELNKQTPLNTVPAVLDKLFKVSQAAVSVSSDLDDLKKNGLALLINKKGAFLIEKFQNLKTRLAEISTLSGDLTKAAEKIGYSEGRSFQNIGGRLGDVDEFLSSFIAWLEASKKQRVLVFFQNPSEIRPSGGFIGSYGFATLFQGNLLEFETRDIYDPDGQLDLKVVPPKQLQGVTDKWGARDANWFFDFPTSARKVIEFLEASKIYSERGMRFSGAVAINVGVLEDIIDVTGPIALPEYDLTIDSGNFLKEIQREVESGEDKAKGEPKRIIKTLAPIIFEKLSSLSEEQKSQLLSRFSERISNKDLMVYFKDPVMEKYIKELGVGGEIAVLPADFSGEYLAVVNSNVAGGKSDAFIQQNIIFTSKIDIMGTANNHLVVERSHNGANEKDWWYKATNKDFLQIYATAGSRLDGSSGTISRVIKPFVDYAKEGYAKDRDLASIENSLTPFGKSVFSGWLQVKAGESGRAVFDYSRAGALDWTQKKSYQFIFDKQSGVNGGLRVSIEAPEGFTWKESGKQTFEYSSDTLQSRIVLDLTPVADQR